ncbi:hypothetical protein [Halobaculum sp. EA56]|uniref:hypothetical protein n=1 Tax=Halobaculum sp. EA56 TaxID=3421648 RepID=UPI003EC0547B
MPESVVLPDGWEQTLDRSNFDSFMDREYTTVAFVHSPTGRKVIINDVQEPNSFGGWGYLIHVTDPEYGELGLVEDLQTAREIAHEFMEEHPN